MCGGVLTERTKPWAALVSKLGELLLYFCITP